MPMSLRVIKSHNAQIAMNKTEKTSKQEPGLHNDKPERKEEKKNSQVQKSTHNSTVSNHISASVFGPQESRKSI